VNGSVQIVNTGAALHAKPREGCLCSGILFVFVYVWLHVSIAVSIAGIRKHPRYCCFAFCIRCFVCGAAPISTPREPTPTYIHTYVRTHTYIQTYRHSHIHTVIQSYSHTFIHSFHTYIYIYICEDRSIRVNSLKQHQDTHFKCLADRTSKQKRTMYVCMCTDVCMYVCMYVCMDNYIKIYTSNAWQTKLRNKI
jgi:hypothetical protein